MTKTQKFTVRGGLSFPLDMLRYDACYPADQAAVSAIQNSVNGLVLSLRENLTEVHLARQVSSVKDMPTFGRWESYGYQVDRKSIVTY